MENQTIKERWVKALRSGEYKQNRFRLKTENGYCCLGVLCDLIKPNSFVFDVDLESYTFEGESSVLTFEIKQLFKNWRQVWILIDLNDAKEMSFNAIANYIEKEIEMFDLEPTT